MKTCRTCQRELPTSGFYGNGYGNPDCKVCVCARVRKNYAEKREQYSEYDRMRYARPDRRASAAKSLKLHRERHPERAIARNAVSNAIRDGRLFRLPCQSCGATTGVQAHHLDYSQPLNVEWFCFPCHRKHGHGQTTTCVDPRPGTGIVPPSKEQS